MLDTVVVAAALLLAVSGVAKLRQPAAAGVLIMRVLRRTARPRAVRLARLVGLGEIAVGSTVVATGSRPAAALLAATYLAFAGVAVAVLRTGGARTSCGCFGDAASPLGPAHLALDAVAAAAGLAAVVRPPGVGAGLVHGGALTAATATAQSVLLAGLGYLAVTSLPALLAARRALFPVPRPAPLTRPDVATPDRSTA